MAPTPLVDLESVRDFLRAVVPEWEWFIAHLESGQGYIRFSRQVADLIKNLKVENYPLLYENESSIGAVLVRGLMDEEEIQAFNREVESASPEERGLTAFERR